MELLTRFQESLDRLVPAKEKRILLAVSGGLDSMVLAHLLLNSGRQFGLAHCNFQLRGEDSDGDESFVSYWAEQHGLPFFSTRFDTQAFADQKGLGIQEAARILRYEWLDMIRHENGFDFIATAHHANDNAETFLLNLFRGSGISGLHGIPVRNERIIRPLLFALREQIRDYSEENKVVFREDASNASDKYRRNALRHHLIPVLETHFPGAVQQINENIVRFSQAEELYRRELERQIKRMTERRGKDIYVPVRKLRHIPAVETVFYEFLKPFGFSPAQSEHALALAESGSGKFIDSATHRLLRDREFLILTSRLPEAADLIQVEAFPCKVKTGDRSFHFSLEKRPDAIPQSSAIALIDARNLVFPLLLRRWRTGDYFYPLGMGMKKKKLSRFFIDQKLPLHEKEQVWVLESQKRIAWVAGLRLDERFKIRSTTEKVLRVEIS